jgi:hypothetical protein
MSWSATIQKAVSDYQNHLKQHCTIQLQTRFDNEFTKGNPEGAISEAVIFMWLSQINLNPEVKENENDGGPDFICKHNNGEFIVEVTCFGKKALEDATLGKEELISSMERIRDGESLTYKLPLTSIKSKLSSQKKRQLSRYNMPRVLAITSLHEWAGVFWFGDKREIEKFLLSECAYKIPKNYDDEIEAETDLKNSLFLHLTKDNPPKIKYRNQFVSAVLLIPIKYDDSNLCVKPTGLLHPKPLYPLDIKVFSNIEFAQIIIDEEDRSIKVDWIHT